MPDDGVVFPEVDGRRSSTATGQEVVAAAAAAVEPELAAAIRDEPRWRTRYFAHARRLLEARTRSAEAAVAAARAGLDALHARMTFARDGAEVPLADAFDLSDDRRALHTVEVRGTGAGETAFSLPWRGRTLAGDALHRQLDEWTADGTVEPTAAEAVRQVLANPDWLDLADQQVVVVGAGAEMGPLGALSRWGAHVLAVDLPRPGLWQAALAQVRAGRGRASVPVAAPVAEGAAVEDAAGADLLTALPEVLRWIEATAGPGPLTVGNYAYADGGLFVRLAAGVDALTEALAARRADVRPAVLATPTDIYAVDEDTVAGAGERWRGRGPAGKVGRALSAGRLFAPGYPGDVAIADYVVPQQGPNYLLAKSVQRWRVTAARADGRAVSLNVGPMTRTRSVMRNRVLAAAYDGAGRFGVEVFEPATSRALMAALLVHDLRNPGAAPADPLRFESHAAAHGGLWRMPYSMRSVLVPAFALGMVAPKR